MVTYNVITRHPHLIEHTLSFLSQKARIKKELVERNEN